MLCERCMKNEATVHYREILNGNEKRYLLCADCAREMEKNGEISFSAPKFFGDDMGMFNSMFGSLFAPQKGVIGDAKKCPLCGATFSELVKEGKVGCAKCYETFERELERTITGIHSQATHTGKSPALFRDKLDVKRRIRSLERELKEAVRDERFERAAQLRDELNGLKAQ